MRVRAKTRLIPVSQRNSASYGVCPKAETSSAPVRLRRQVEETRSKLDRLIGIASQIPAAQPISRALLAASRRLQWYWEYSEAGTHQCAESDVQAALYREELKRTADLALLIVNDQTANAERRQTLLKALVFVIELHNTPVPTFPPAMNATRLRLTGTAETLDSEEQVPDHVDDAGQQSEHEDRLEE